MLFWILFLLICTKVLVLVRFELGWVGFMAYHPCAVSRRLSGIVQLTRNKDAEVRSGVEMLSSRRALKCWSQSRSWDAVVRTGIKMLKSKQEFKISNLFLRGSVGLEGEMNDERMISQTPMAHKLDVLSSKCLVDSLWWERKRMVFCYKQVRKQRKRMCSLTLVALSCCLSGRKRREDKNGLRGLLCCPRRWAGQNGISHSHWTKYVNSKLQRPKQFPH